MKRVRQPYYGAGGLLRLGRLLLGFLLLSLLATGLPAKDRVVYYHNDALGSPIAATDVSGELLWREDYAPYGQRLRREDDGTNRLWYTGKEEELALGLHYYGARWYDADIGRFLARDPAVFDEGNPQSFNQYAYANNNPYRYVDPNGAWAEDAVFAVPSLLVGGHSLADNIARGNILGAAVDVLGFLVDVTAAALPGVPGGAGLGIMVSRRAAELDGAMKAPVVIGENMKRVNDYSRKISGETIDDWLAGREWTQKLNDEFISAMKSQGREFRDIGPDFDRRLRNRVNPSTGRPPSSAYGSERESLSGYGRYNRLYERSGRYEGGVYGFDQ